MGSVFDQVPIWKSDSHKRSKEVNVNEKFDIGVANLNSDKKSRRTIGTEVANLNLENEKIKQTIQVVNGKVDELVKLLLHSKVRCECIQILFTCHGRMSLCSRKLFVLVTSDGAGQATSLGASVTIKTTIKSLENEIASLCENDH